MVVLLLGVLLVLGSAVGSAHAVRNPQPWNQAESQSLLLLSFSAYCGGAVNSSFNCYWSGPPVLPLLFSDFSSRQVQAVPAPLSVGGQLWQ